MRGGRWDGGRRRPDARDQPGLRAAARDGRARSTTIRSRGLKVGALTNNWAPSEPQTDHAPHALGHLGAFDVVVESAVEGLRKPDPRIYELVCERLGVDAAEAVFLDDLGINLKPARAMGMTTIKVVDPDDALAELAAILGFALDGA